MNGFVVFGGILGFVFIVFVIVLVIKLDVEMADIAESKGYDRKSAFVYCFFLGVLGFIYILALPNKKDKQNAIKEIKRENIIDNKLFEIEKTNKTHDGDTVYVLKLYCENKTYDYKFTEGFRKRNSILEFVENCKQKNYDGADEYLDRLSTDEKFISFVNKD